MNYIIVGNSAAAIGTVEGIRQIDKDSTITIVSKEKEHTYSRPLISYFLGGKVSEKNMSYRDKDFYKTNNVDLLLGKTVTSVDANAHTVKLDDNSTLSYDKLMIATGSSPFVPPCEGLDSVKDKFSFMTLEDAKELKKAITKNSKVLIVGAGLIGLKCAEGLIDSVASISVIDMAPRILSSILDTEGSAIVQKYLEEKNLKFFLDDCVTSYTKNSANLKSGKKIEFDILVLAVGVRANIGLIKDIGGECNRGIIVNSKLETSKPDIYAAGDCSEGFDISLGKNRVLALLPNAYMQGEVAGKNMALSCSKKTKSSNNDSQDVQYFEYDNGIPVNSMGLLGLHMVTAGTYEGDIFLKKDTNVSCLEKANYKKLFYDKTLKGFIIIGDIKRSGIYSNLIRKQIPISEIDFNLMCEEPALLPFTKVEREKMLSRLH